MYEFISGNIAELNSSYAVIEAGGVGYFINISLQSYNQLEGNAQGKLYIHFIVREDAQILYGFTQKQEREIFRLLLGVSGVGGNTARVILSTYTCNDLASIISTGNDRLLKNVKGLGIKTAQKIIVELKDKIFASTEPSQTAIPNTDQTTIDEALSALTMLGFSKAMATKAINSILKTNPNINIEELIKQALKLM